MSILVFFVLYLSLCQGDGPGSPLFLTPYINANRTEEGRDLAKVPSLHGEVESYSGFFTVNTTYNSNLFFWFLPSENLDRSAPIILWLQGGPGLSSLYGSFTEIGPYEINTHQKLVSRKIHWSQKYQVIFIDNPVGTGFSFTEVDDGYARDEERIGQELYSALVQFFTLFPSYVSNDFYIAGESYAGKYIPALAYTIHTNRLNPVLTINLKGIAIGNGLVDPVNMMHYGRYLYEIGLIDELSKRKFQNLEDEVRSYIYAKDFKKATECFGKLIDGDYFPYKTLFKNETGFDLHYNYLHTKDYFNEGDMNKFLNKNSVRNKFHVGSVNFSNGAKVVEYLTEDIMKSVKSWLEVLMENYKVVLYDGQLDIICAHPLTMNYVSKLNWSGAEEFLNAPREKWYFNNELVGYYTSVRNFTSILIRNAGHIVPADQPEVALKLISKFLTSQ